MENSVLSKEFSKNDMIAKNKDIIFEIFSAEKHLPETDKETNTFSIHTMNEVLGLLYVYNLKNKKFVFINKNAFCGHPTTNLTHILLIPNSIHIDDLPVLREIFKGYYDGLRHNLTEIDFRMKNASGEWEWVHGKISVLTKNEQGLPEDIVGQYTIITKYKRIQEELTVQKEELSKFAHIMAHDLRNFLITIEGFAVLLQTNYDKVYIEKIITQTKNASNLLQESLDLADTGQVIKRTHYVDLNKFISEVAEVIIPKNIRFSYDDLPTVYADENRLFQIFKNIFENAVNHGKPSIIEIKKRTTSQGIYLYISNNGKQISKQQRKSIFKQNPVYEEKLESGYGLKIVKKFVEAHNWKIKLLPKLETTFCIFIPMKDIKGLNS